MQASLLEGRYAIGDQIGGGATSCIFAARDRVLDADVAIKVPTPQAERDARAVLRLEREGRIGTSIRHENVCAALRIGRTPSGAPFLVLDRLRGETLAARLLREQRCEPSFGITMLEGILAGLSAVHARGVVHRDVKPANIFLAGDDDAPTPRIVDFGAAVSTDPKEDGASLTDEGFAFGTLEYMAPEQVRGVRDLDARADVYSSAVVAWELFTGIRPYATLPRHELASAIAFGGAPLGGNLPELVPPAVARAIGTALAIDRERRHPHAGAFLFALRSDGDPWSIATAEFSCHRTLGGR
jgi:serine/threonine-protein kinase